MAKTTTRDVAVDPHFFVPSGVIDVRQANGEEGEYYYDDSTYAEEGPTLDTPEAIVPMPPSSYEIVEQRVRISADGSSVVDVYIEFPETEGIFQIDMDVSKV